MGACLPLDYNYVSHSISSFQPAQVSCYLQLKASHRHNFDAVNKLDWPSFAGGLNLLQMQA